MVRNMQLLNVYLNDCEYCVVEDELIILCVLGVEGKHH